MGKIPEGKQSSICQIACKDYHKNKRRSKNQRTRRFNAAFTRAFQQSLPWSNSTKFLVSIPISLISILILSSHLRLDLPKGLFPVGSSVKILKAVLSSSILATWPVHETRHLKVLMYWVMNLINLIFKKFPRIHRVPKQYCAIALSRLDVQNPHCFKHLNFKL